MNHDGGGRPVRVAIIGSGPSGLFTADALLKSNLPFSVDVFEQLPSPFGLVRFGVAPDHANIKKVINKFERILDSKGISFYGNVTVGKDIRVDELRRHYDIIVFACGALRPKCLNIPGEHLTGNHAAIEFIGWLNGLPRYRQAQFDFSHECAAIIGNGNVALDVARILSKTAGELRYTDIASHALDELAKSNVRHITIIGRRGPAQAAFSYKELKDIDALNSSEFYVDSRELELNETSQEELSLPGNREKQRMVAFLNQVAARSVIESKKRVELKFLRSPVSIVGETHVEKLICEKNRLQGPPGEQLSYGTGETEELKCSLIFSSIGYRGKPIDGTPFDNKKGIFENQNGRILLNGSLKTGMYAVGWVQGGPTGLIGNSKQDGAATADRIVEDLPSLPPCPQPDREAIHKLLRCRQVQIINFDDWKKIDAAEKNRGEPFGKPRQKFCSVKEMLSAL